MRERRKNVVQYVAGKGETIEMAWIPQSSSADSVLQVSGYAMQAVLIG